MKRQEALDALKAKREAEEKIEMLQAWIKQEHRYWRPDIDSVDRTDYQLDWVVLDEGDRTPYSDREDPTVLMHYQHRFEPTKSHTDRWPLSRFFEE